MVTSIGEEYNSLMKILIPLFILLISVSSFADCSQALSGGYAHDSKAYQLYEDEVNLELSRNTTEFATEAVLVLQQKLGCMNEKSATTFSNVSCNQVVPGVRLSSVCYLEGQTGYFLVSVDMLENINIVYNRFD